MASFGFTVNPAEIEERGGNFKKLPAGKYLLQAMTGDIEPNKSGTGQNVWFSFEVVSGEHQGVDFRHYINNIIHEDADRQAFGQRELGEFARAVNVIASDTEPFLFKPFTAEVHFFPAGYVEKGKNGYEFTYKYDTNKIARYKAAEGSTPTSAQRATTAPMQRSQPAPVAGQVADRVQAAPVSAAKVAPWNRAKVA